MRACEETASDVVQTFGLHDTREQPLVDIPAHLLTEFRLCQQLGRNLAGNAANVTVNLIEPGTLYGDRINELDLRVAKALRLGRWRAHISADV